MKSEIPFFAIGNNELKDKKQAGKFAKCPHCKKNHLIKFGKKKMEDGTWKTSELLGFVNCDKKTYLVSVQSKLLD